MVLSSETGKMSQANIVVAKYRTLSTSSAYSSCSDDLEDYDNHEQQPSPHHNNPDSYSPCKNLKRYSTDQLLPSLVVKHYEKSRHNRASLDPLVLPTPLAKCPRIRNNSSIGSLSSDLDCCLDEVGPEEAKGIRGNDLIDLEMEDLGVALQNLFKSPRASSLAKNCENGNRINTSRKSVTFSESVQRSFFRSGDSINRCRRKMHKVKLKEADDIDSGGFYKNFHKEVYYPPSNVNKTRRKRNKKT